MRILGYQASRPNLRLLRLPEEVVEPSPVPVNARIALDHGFARDGWLVFMPGQEVRGVPVPLEGEAFRVGRWWDCVPAPNPRTVWLANPDDGGDDEHAPTVVAEYDVLLLWPRKDACERSAPAGTCSRATVPCSPSGTAPAS